MAPPIRRPSAVGVANSLNTTSMGLAVPASTSIRAPDSNRRQPNPGIESRSAIRSLLLHDLDSDKTAYLQTLCAGRGDVEIYTGDANEYLRSLLPRIQYSLYNRALCLLDPYGLQLDWDIIHMTGRSQAIDLFLNFPVMDMNRNAIWRSPERATGEGVERMNRFWGDESWKQAAYAQGPQPDLFSGPEIVKQPNDSVVAAFRERLMKVAGFTFVPEPLPMRNSNNAVVYYLFFASAKPVADTIIQYIFHKHR